MKYDYIFFSPHFDDAILSCGGLIAKLKKTNKKVLIVTIFSEVNNDNIISDAAQHIKASGFDNVWDLNAKRKNEEKKIEKILQIKTFFLKETEANFRSNYQNYNDMIGTKNLKKEKKLITKLNKKIINTINIFLRKTGKIYFPLAVGQHVDHLIVNKIGVDLSKKFNTFFWEDYPYLMYLKNKILDNRYSLNNRIDIKEELILKRKLINQYQSQTNQLFCFKPMFLSSFENYFECKKYKKNKIFYITDELIGGAKIANDYIINNLNFFLKEKLEIYEQVPPKINGHLKNIKKVIWSIANFYRYLKLINNSDQIITTTPNLLTALFISRKKIKKVIYYSHSDRGGDYPKFPSKAWLFWFIYRTVESISSKRIDLIIVPSENAKERMIKRLGKYVKNKFKIIPNGVDSNIFKPLGIQREKDTVMYCGRIHPNKQIDILVKAVKKNKKIKLLIVSSKENIEDQNYAQSLKKLGGNQITWIKPKNTQDIVKNYNQSTCVVIPSNNESFSLVLLEALACKTSVIGMNIGEIGVILKKIDPKLLLKKGDFHEIADKISYVIGLDKNQRKKLAVKCRKEAISYKWQKSTKKLLAELL